MHDELTRVDMEKLRQELTYGLLAPEEDPQLEAARSLLLDKIANKP